MNRIEHTAACLKKQAARQQAQTDWRAKCPDHCTHCEGNTDSETPCPYCLAILTCPRCDQPNAMDAFDAKLPCDYCGYVEGYNDAGCPPDYVCQCRMAKVAEAERDVVVAQRALEKAEKRLARLTDPPIRIIARLKG